MKKVKYRDETHQYFLGNTEIPSVSRLVEFACGSSYANIPTDVLNKAAEYGTSVHNAIEKYERSGEVEKGLETQVSAYQELKKKYLLEVDSMEEIITDGKNYAGRYDILDTQKQLWDIKTTSKTYIEKWEWQLSLYSYALKLESNVAFIIYIPKKGKSKVILINLHSKEEVQALIELYNEAKNQCIQ